MDSIESTPESPKKAMRPAGTGLHAPLGAASLVPSRRPPVHAAALLQRWDRASRQQRIAILVDFNKRFQGVPSSEVDRAMGPSAALFFTRVLTWVRLTYELGYELAVQLTTLSIFVQSPTSLSTFVEVGGIPLLTDILFHVGRHVVDRSNTLLLLVHIANSGRSYREMMCDGTGVDVVVRSMLHERDERVLDLFASLFVALGHGNPRRAGLVHAGLLYVVRNGGDDAALSAASTLRSMQIVALRELSTAVILGAEGGRDADTLLDAYFHLLQSPSVRLRYEGSELLLLAAHSAPLTSAMVRRCIDALRRPLPAEEGEQRSVAKRGTMAVAKVLTTVLLQSRDAEEQQRLWELLDAHEGHVVLVRCMGLYHAVDPGEVTDAASALRALLLRVFPALRAKSAAHTHAEGIFSAALVRALLSPEGPTAQDIAAMGARAAAAEAEPVVPDPIAS